MDTTPRYRAWDIEYSHMYTNAYPFEHLVYVEMDMNDPDVQSMKYKMMEVNGKWFYWILAKNVELMPYVGRKDRHGNEICVDDIVRYGYFALNDHNLNEEQRCAFDGTEITTTIKIFRVKWDYHELSDLHTLIWGNPDVTGVEIIGNIFENPDLLKD